MSISKGPYFSANKRAGTVRHLLFCLPLQPKLKIMIALKSGLAILFAIIVSFTANAQTKTGGVKVTVLNFMDAINSHDATKIAVQMANEHVFIDASGNEVQGKVMASSKWGDYFSLVPDYHISFTQVFVNGDTLGAFGFEEGSYKGKNENHWRLPASWKAIVQKQKVKFWQEYTDTKLPFDLMGKSSTDATANPIAHVTGVGGLFFKCKDPKSVRNWYKEHLHLDTSPYGTKFEWRQGDDPTKYGCTQWSIFGEKSTYFAPSTKDFMINYRVNNLEQLVGQLRKDNVTVVDSIEDTDYGKFVHIMDCEDNKVELWEPKNLDFNKVVGERLK